MFKRVRSYAVLAVGVLVATLVPSWTTATASADTGPVARVEIVNQAREGSRGTIQAQVWVTCQPGYLPVDLAADFSQGDVVTPTQVFTPGIACDGQWHLRRISSLEAFEVADTNLRVELTLIDEVHQDPAPLAVDEEVITVRAAAGAQIGAVGKVVTGGKVAVNVAARCDRPWVEPNLSIRVDQGNFGADFNIGPDRLTCDGQWHWFRPRFTPPAGFRFKPGFVEVVATISILDPDHFDPVTSHTQSRAVPVS